MKLITRITLPLTLTALALTGCSSQTVPAETPRATTTATTSATPTKTATSAPSRSATATPEPTMAAVEPAPITTPSATLDTASGAAWYTDQEDPDLLSQYGLISDVYYPRMDDRNIMCAQTQPTVCTTPEDRLAFMDASISQFQDDYAAENPGTGDDIESAPLRESDPYAGLTDEEIADLPVTGMP